MAPSVAPELPSESVRIAPSVGPMQGDQPIANAMPATPAATQAAAAADVESALRCQQPRQREPGQHDSHGDHERARHDLERPAVLEDRVAEPTDTCA